MELVLSELATVVPRGYGDHAGTARSLHAGAHRRFNRAAVQTIDNDLEHRVHAIGQLGLNVRAAAEARTVGIVGRRNHLLVMLRPDFAPRSDDAAWKWKNHAGDAAHCGNGRF